MKAIRCLYAGIFAVICIDGVGAAEFGYGIQGAPVTSTDPYSSGGPAAAAVLRAVFDGLTRLGTNGEPAPALAVS